MHRFILGVYHHAPPENTGFSYYTVAPTWTNETIAFASSYAAKAALFLRRFPIAP